MMDELIKALSKGIEVEFKQPNESEIVITLTKDAKRIQKSLNVKNKLAFKNSLNLSLERAIMIGMSELIYE